MDLGRPSLRLLGVLAVAALPPLVAFGVVNAVGAEWLAERGRGSVLAVAALVAFGWVGIVAVVFSRMVGDEAQSMLDVVQRGSEPATDSQRRLASTLEERNRQISALAAQVREAPITADASAVARAVVHGARSMTGDPTWELAVLRMTDETELRAGVYRPDMEQPAALEDVHRWAATQSDAGPLEPRHSVGPWGAFVTIQIQAGEDLRAILLAPWEGRAPPSPSELDLLGLLAQYAATALEHTLLYARLRHQAVELNRMAVVQSDFLRGVSHDLQTPLTSIRALASEVGQSATLDAAARADLDAIAHQADRLRRMVAQLLTVSRLDAGALTPRQEVFRVAPVIHRTWGALRVDGRFEVVDEGPAHLVVADADRLEQVLWAVLDNAAKYSPSGASIAVTLSARQAEGGLVSQIVIQDEGAGMDPQALEHAFEQFYRAPDAPRFSPDGSGVGLYAARGLVEAMGGQISAASELGVGTTVTITLPAELADEPMDNPAG